MIVNDLIIVSVVCRDVLFTLENFLDRRFLFFLVKLLPWLLFSASNNRENGKWMVHQELPNYVCLLLLLKSLAPLLFYSLLISCTANNAILLGAMCRGHIPLDYPIKNIWIKDAIICILPNHEDRVMMHHQ